MLAERGADQVVEWRQFEVGTWVRVNPSPECQTYRRPGWQSDEPGHSPDETGLVGIIVSEDEPPFNLWPAHHFKGHPYLVDFQRPVRVDGHYSYGAMYYAAAELEPAGPPPPGGDGSEG